MPREVQQHQVGRPLADPWADAGHGKPAWRGRPEGQRQHNHDEECDRSRGDVMGARGPKRAVRLPNCHVPILPLHLTPLYLLP